MAERTYLEAIRETLRDELRRDERVFVIGQDVGAAGGAFKATDGLQQEFGAARVIDAPLAETAIVGACTGAAIAGMRPVAEMQFADFVSCAWDHLVTVAAKQHYRTGIRVPIVVRLPSGGGFSGGPFHSQNPESSFAHVPGLKIACPSTPADAKGLLLAALDDPNPVLYFEHKHLYRRLKGEVPEGREPIELGRARVHRPGDDATVVTWGAMVHTAERRRRPAGGGGRRRGRGARPADDPALGPRGRARVRAPHLARARAARGHPHRPASARRSPPPSPTRRSATSTRRCAAWRRPTRRSRSRRRSSGASCPASTTSWPSCASSSSGNAD